MTSRSISTAAIISALLFGCDSGQSSQPPVALTSVANDALMPLSTASNPLNIEFENASGSVLKEGDQQRLQVLFAGKSHLYSAVILRPEQPWDWSDLEDFHLAMDIANPGDHSVQIFLDIQDIDGANYTRSVAIPMGPSKTYYAKIHGHDLATPDGEENVELNFLSGLRSNPDTWQSDDTQFISMWGQKNLNIKGITEIRISVQHNLFDKELEITNLRLRKNPAFNDKFLTDIVDQFGQNANVDFPGKIHSLEELQQARINEAKELTGQLMPEFSKFGGWKNGPKLDATGYFRTEKYQGKWSLVDPEGYLYFATGLDILRLANSSTMTGYDYDNTLIDDVYDDGVTPDDSKGPAAINQAALPTRHLVSEMRNKMFTWLPSHDEPLAKWYGYRPSAHSGAMTKGETFSFYGANLERKYGEQAPIDAWREVTVKRMMSWGFTSLGNWTDPSFYDNNKVPFFANGWIIGDFKTVSSGNDFWAPLPDVFDPEFERRAFITIEVVAQQVKNSPWCVGIFVDNEKSFGRGAHPEGHYGIVFHTLRRDGAEVPTKAAFTNIMKDKYQTIDALNQAWDKSFGSWDEFNQGADSTLNTDAQLADYAILLHAYGAKYFETVNKAIDHYLPNHLYLGARFPDWGMPKEIIEAAAKHVDVVSYNIYKEGLHPQKWGFLDDIDMPSIIGEFHIGAMDNGLFHPGLIHAADQNDRARMFEEYLHSVIDNPNFVGAHWFQYMDSPITGRAFDGENYNVGFVNVADTPYRPMVEAARRVNSSMYQRRFGK
ncbi:beta-galactosidase [Neiella sp. HB171785]|uniref:Beta-galactosidase n=1 Tax=Neiella litorisoli TaxID=2771431 RepID=A0A8J6UJ71_9GAMM|nr:beta-galactosidase [Neiella litorisoli]MBD1390018.1 beta-galactosidase [Neiella litorisoli]